MKKLIITISLIAFGLAFNSCQKELTAVNLNPNNLESADPNTLLSNTIVSEFYNNSNVVWTLGNGYDQYMTFSSQYYDQPTRYLPVTNEPYWISLYTAARDANTLYSISIANKNTFLESAALTLRSYAFAQLTELWGDIPFTKALNGATGVFTPGYDNQQVVYTDANLGIIPSLRKADSLLKANPIGILGGDVLYNSSIPSWRKFINALRLRYLLRVSSKINVSQEMQSIVSDGTLMNTSAQSATLQLPSITPYNFVSLTERSGDFAVKYMNNVLYNAYLNTGDTARISVYFATHPGISAGTPFSFSNYGGLPILVDATTSQTALSSNFNSSFTNGSNKPLIAARIITYSEQEFILAEAALKGYITGTASSYYNNGVLGAYAEIGLDNASANRYLNHSGVVFDGSSLANSLNQIITQKWLVNINNGFEGWIEFRRTGIPALQTGGSANLNGGLIPTRFLYPTSEATINSTNYNIEINANFGGKENTNYKAWWEK